MSRLRLLAWAALVPVLGITVALADRTSLARAGRVLVTDPAPLVLALSAYTAAFALRAAAWGELLPVPVALGQRVRAMFAMIAVNHAVPGPVGEVVRARVVSGPDLPLRRAMLSVAAARVVDVGAIALLLMATAWTAGGLPGWARFAAPAGAVLPFAVLAVAHRRGADLSMRAAARMAVLAVPAWVLECGIVLVVARAAGAPLSVEGAVLATCAGVLAQVAAVLPGGIGTYEAGVASALTVVGIPFGQALAIAATSHAIKFAYSFAVGLPALGWKLRVRVAT